jgi:tubulin-folding cofactor B
MKAKDPHWKPPKPTMMAGNPWQKAPEGGAEEPPTGPETVAGVEVGMRCEVHPGERRGVVMFVGEHANLSPGFWVGVRFDEPRGKSAGSIKGVKVFECEEGHGGWIRGHNVKADADPSVYAEKGFSLESDDEEDEL